MIDTYKLAMLVLEMMAYQRAARRTLDPTVTQQMRNCEAVVQQRCEQIRDEHNNGLRLDLK